jgi:hypothetical protein
MQIPSEPLHQQRWTSKGSAFLLRYLRYYGLHQPTSPLPQVLISSTTHHHCTVDGKKLAFVSVVTRATGGVEDNDKSRLVAASTSYLKGKGKGRREKEKRSLEERAIKKFHHSLLIRFPPITFFYPTLLTTDHHHHRHFN